jgi:hypothetical protein
MDSTDNTASTTHFQVPRRAVWVGLALVCLAGTAYAVVGSGLLRSAAGRDGATAPDPQRASAEPQGGGSSNSARQEFERARAAFRYAARQRKADRAGVQAQIRYMQQTAGQAGALGLQWEGFPEPNPQIEAMYQAAAMQFIAVGATDADIREVERELQESPNNRGRQAGGGR